ncbi:hypothetical protein SynMINOS11_00209 [Synechococcus sp. Minos11]|nr:hypothetical protein SynMINOS11_00209 [Synechococcus sp. Minos11]
MTFYSFLSLSLQDLQATSSVPFIINALLEALAQMSLLM